MTNLDIIKYLATNNPARLAELLDDIYCSAWNCGSCAGSTGKIMEECEIDDFGEWINQEASKSGFYFDHELEEWSKDVSHPSIEITYPDNLVIQLPWDGKDPNHMWNTDNNFNIINQAIDEIQPLETIMETEKYSNATYTNFRKEVCVNCLQECLQSQMDIVECPEFKNFCNAKEN